MAKRWHGTESRWGTRLRVDIPVQVAADGLVDAGGCMKNLSLSGALVKADVDFGLHSIIQVIIATPALPRTASISAYVSRKAAEGVGVEWCEYGPSVVKDLLRPPSIPP